MAERTGRAWFVFGVLFVSIIVALAAVNGLARAAGLAIADPSFDCGPGFGREVEPPSATPPIPSPPPGFENQFSLPPEVGQITIATPPPAPDAPPVPAAPGAPAQPIEEVSALQLECKGPGSGAVATAARSGTLLLAAFAIGFPHARLARTLLGEERDG